MDGELELLGERIAEHAAHLDAAMHRLLADLREFDQRGGWHVQGARSCAHWLSWRVGWDLSTAREHVRVAGKLAEFPTIDDALRRGEISYSKVRAMVRVATPENELLLLDHARLTTGAQLEVICRKYALVLRHGQDPHPLGDLQRRHVRRRDTEDGMVKIEAVLHPEEAELVWTMLNHAATQLTRAPESSTCDDSAEAPESCNALAVFTGEDVAGAREPMAVCGTTSPTVDLVACAVDASAEAPEPMQACTATSTSPAVHVATCIDDLIESCSTQACGTTYASPSADVAICQIDDVAATSEPTPVSGTSLDLAAVHVATCEIDDSAESRGVVAACRTASAAPTVQPATGAVGDSAESRDLVAASSTVARGSTGHGAASLIEDSAEARMRMSACNAMAARSAEQGEAASSSDTSELWESKSLLERLLDEADALRNSELVPRTDRGGTPTEPPASGPASMLHRRADAARRGFSRADALVSLAQGYLRGDRPNRAPIEITLTIPASSLRAGDADTVEVGEMGDSFVSCEAARRLSCDAGVVDVIEDEHGAPLSVGRKRRAITGALKRALHQRDKTCTYPGCTNRLFLEGHHIQHWADGGETSLMNATLLCSFHHHFVHEYGYTIELDSEQRPQFRDPHGRLIVAVPERPVTADLGWPHIRAANETLAIDADTIACEWDGRPVNYGAVVGHLLAADGLQ